MSLDADCGNSDSPACTPEQNINSWCTLNTGSQFHRTPNTLFPNLRMMLREVEEITERKVTANEWNSLS